MTNPTKAFILAAGHGRRMRPLTDHIPKPLVRVAERPLLDHIVDHLARAGVKDIVVNAHYKADQVENWGQSKSPKINVITEEDLLDTGGGVKNALDFFGDEPFYVVAGDAFWVNGPAGETLLQLAAKWDDKIMDTLMVLQDVKTMRLTRGVGDYDLKPDGRARRSRSKNGQYMFTNIRINHPRIFKNAPMGAFSFLDLMDHAQEEGRLFGMAHEGDWHHISTPEDLQRVNNELDERKRASS